MVPFFSLAFKVVFFRKGLNYTEHFIINCYAYGITELIALIGSIILIFVPNTTAVQSLLGFLVWIFIFTYFYLKVLNRSPLITIIQSMFSIILGFLLFLIIFSIIFSGIGYIYR